MCFRIKTPPEKASKDLVSWKVMQYDSEGNLNSSMYPVKGGYQLGESIFGTAAFHNHLRRHVMKLSKLQSLSSEVVHSLDNYDTADKVRFWYEFYGNKTFVIVKCIIPKGTWYWVDAESHEFASLQVRLEEVYVPNPQKDNVIELIAI